MGGPPTKDCWASDSAKVALSLRDRKRDQQGDVDLPSHLGSTANATRVFSLPVAERQGYHTLATAPIALRETNPDCLSFVSNARMSTSRSRCQSDIGSVGRRNSISDDSLKSNPAGPGS